MYIRVVVYPGAKKEFIKKIGDERYEIAVKVPAERNLANVAVREKLAVELGVQLGHVKIVSGHQSSRKILSVSN